MMNLFWASVSTQAVAQMQTMRSAEAKLMKLAKNFGNQTNSSYTMVLQDTPIPPHVLPLKHEPKDIELMIHSVHLEAVPENDNGPRKNKTPLVLLHGYMNGALYFYRNLVGLTHHFESIHSLDLLGWGLSSRPNFSLTDSSVESAEAFFVESLEAWRKAQNIDKMILAGHSMGGYMSVAYCERYPQHVEQLVLISPAGVTRRSEEFDERFSQMPWSRRLLFNGLMTLFEAGTTPGSVMRVLSTYRGRSMVEGYVKRRLPAISDPEEQEALTDYLYTNAILPASGEYVLNRVLEPPAYGKSPTVDRIPHLKVPKISFLYGQYDWMDIQGGIEVGQRCSEFMDNGTRAPSVDVYQVRNAGHLLMLENWEEFNAGILNVCGGAHFLSASASLPLKVQLPISNLSVLQ